MKIIFILGILVFLFGVGIYYNNSNNDFLILEDYEVKGISKEQAYQYAKEEAEFYKEINYEGGKTFFIPMK